LARLVTCQILQQRLAFCRHAVHQLVNRRLPLDRHAIHQLLDRGITELIDVVRHPFHLLHRAVYRVCNLGDVAPQLDQLRP
jgi:hypothetical protein